jgi:alpha-mannosidase
MECGTLFTKIRLFTLAMNRRKFLQSTFAAGCLGSVRGEGTQDKPPLYLLTYDHGGLVLWGVPHFVETFTQAISWLDRYPKFKIGLDNEAYLYDYLAEHDPQTLALIRNALTQYKGRLGIGSCTYGQPLMCFLNDESNIRQIQFAVETVKQRFGRKLSVYLMSEHAMHSQIPQILNGLGFWGAIMRTHFMMYGYNPTFNVGFGKWVGLDGTQINAIPTYTGEGAGFGKTTVDNWILTRCPGPQCGGKTLEGFREEFRNIHPLLASRADDAALRREALVQEVENQPQDRWVLLEDLPEIFKQPQADFKTLPNDFVVRMPWGYCGNEIWNRSREAEVSVLIAERIAALAWHAAGGEYEKEIKESWRNLLIAQHHDIQICGLVPEARKYLNRSISISKAVTDQALQAVAHRMEGGKVAQITVFNPSSWTRTEWIEVTVDLPSHFANRLNVRYRGDIVPSEIVSALRGSSGNLQQAGIALRVEVSPLAFQSYSVEAAPGAEPDAESTPDALQFESNYWRLELHPEGGIAALTSVKTGKPLLAPGTRSGFFAGVINGIAVESKGVWHILNPVSGSNYFEAHEHGEIGGIPYSSKLLIWRDSPRLDFRIHFEFEKERIGRLSQNPRDATSPFLHEEKLRFKLFPALKKDDMKGVRDLPFAIAETPDRYIQGNYWTAVTGKDSGLAVFNRGTMSLVREDDGGVSVPLAYSMYYIWGTRILNGIYEYELALWPFESAWVDAQLHRHALEYAFPLPASVTTPGDGSLGKMFRPIEIECESSLITALYRNAGNIFLRVFADSNSPGKASINRQLFETDLNNRVADSISNPVELRPWQFRTVAF